MTPDDFEARFMHDGSRVLHRDKRVSRGMAAILAVPGLLALLLSVFVAVENASAAKPLSALALPVVVAGLAAFGLAFLVMAIAFAVIRVVVTERDVHVKYALWGPQVPLARITSCRVVDYEWSKYGGWGIRRGADGSWAYVATDGKVVELVYEDEDGTSKKILVGARDADELARSIEQARRKRGGKRIALGGAVTVDQQRAWSDAEAEAEEEAGQDEVRAMRK